MSVDESRPTALLTERGHDTDAIREDALIHGIDPVIPARINHKVRRFVGPLLHGLHNRIDLFVTKMQNARRVAACYDKTAHNFLAFVRLALIKLWLKLVNTTYRTFSRAGY